MTYNKSWPYFTICGWSKDLDNDFGFKEFLIKNYLRPNRTSGNNIFPMHCNVLDELDDKNLPILELLDRQTLSSYWFWGYFSK